MGILTRSKRMRFGAVTGVAGVTGVDLVLHRNISTESGGKSNGP